MKVESRYDFDKLITAVLREVTIHRPAVPMLAIDECLNHPLIEATVIQACNAGLANGAGPLWNQRRVRDDGSVCYVFGGAPRDYDSSFIGKPAKHAVWDDQKVVCCLIPQLLSNNVVLLSENIRFDKLGLRRILLNIVAPKLNSTVSLTSLFKRGKTPYRDFCGKVITFLSKRHLKGGYDEILL